MISLVTGAAGFIGSTLSEALVDSGDSVIGLDSFLDYYPRSYKESNLCKLQRKNNFELIDAAIQDIDLAQVLGRCDRVFHLAAQAGVRSSWGKEFSIYTQNNILATQHLLEAATKVNLEALVFASSSAVYGDAGALPMREDSLLRPISPYGVSKLAGEKLVDLYHRNYELPTVSIRYFTVYGPRQRPDMAFHRLLKSAHSGEKFPLFGDGSQTRDFTFVTDAVSATIAAASNGARGQSYNIGGGSQISMLEVIECIKNITGRDINVEQMSIQKGDMRDTYADISRAKKDFDYNPSVSLTDGLSRELKWLETSKLF